MDLTGAILIQSQVQAAIYILSQSVFSANQEDRKNARAIISKVLAMKTI